VENVQIGLNVTRGNLPEAIGAAKTYLEIYQTDAVVWEKLHGLYLQTGAFQQAQYCLEEAVLHSPGNALNLQRLGDLHYAQVRSVHIPYLSSLHALFPAHVSAVVRFSGAPRVREGMVPLFNPLGL
jgi:tetratricopeptide (TPR) repeat protein